MEDKEKIDEVKRELLNIEIDWDNEDDLISLSENEQFCDFILEESLKAIIDALKNKKPQAELFNIFNMSVIIELPKTQFKAVLKRINNMFIKNEEYERCSNLQKLIQKYEL